MKKKIKNEKVLLLRTCDKDMKGHGGFQWPKSGPIEAPDWDPDPNVDCGQGLALKKTFGTKPLTGNW